MRSTLVISTQSFCLGEIVIEQDTPDEAERVLAEAVKAGDDDVLILGNRYRKAARRFRDILVD